MSALLEIDGLAVGYDGMRALQDVSLSAEAGTIVALVGANGAGKTSLLRAISGLVRAERGTIRFDGDGHHAHPRAPHRAPRDRARPRRPARLRERDRA